jgi:hypothetical protein
MWRVIVTMELDCPLGQSMTRMTCKPAVLGEEKKCAEFDTLISERRSMKGLRRISLIKVELMTCGSRALSEPSFQLPAGPITACGLKRSGTGRRFEENDTGPGPKLEVRNRAGRDGQKFPCDFCSAIRPSVYPISTFYSPFHILSVSSNCAACVIHRRHASAAFFFRTNAL